MQSFYFKQHKKIKKTHKQNSPCTGAAKYWFQVCHELIVGK